MRGRIISAHILFIIINLFIVLDFWQVRQGTDRIVEVQQRKAYNTGRSTARAHAFGLYKIRTNHYAFTIPEKHAWISKEDSQITIYYTRFLRIVQRIEVKNQSIPISFGLYATISLAIVAIAIAALSLYKHPIFQSFAATINVLLSLMVIYMIWF